MWKIRFIEYISFFLKISDERLVPCYLKMKGTMNKKMMSNNKAERRSESRKVPEKYYSVEFSIKGLDYIYQFKLRDISEKGVCIVVKNNSAVLNFIKINDVISMKYYVSESPTQMETLKTKIKHITKYDEGRFKGHCLLGLSVL